MSLKDHRKLVISSFFNLKKLFSLGVVIRHEMDNLEFNGLPLILILSLNSSHGEKKNTLLKMTIKCNIIILVL